MKIRKSARVVLLNDHNEVFLFRHQDSRRTYWVLPGGGVEEGETWEEAAIREMWEETGIADVPLGSCLWTRSVQGRLNGEEIVSDERYFLVRCGSSEVSNANQLDYERTHYTVHGWWSLDDMRASGDTFYPEDLASLIEPVVAGEAITDPVHLQRSAWQDH